MSRWYSCMRANHCRSSPVKCIGQRVPISLEVSNMRLNSTELSQLRKQDRPFGLADQILHDISHYDFDLDSVAHYDDAVKDEIVSGICDLRKITDTRTTPHLRIPHSRLAELAVTGNAIERDQAVWQLL